MTGTGTVIILAMATHTNHTEGATMQKVEAPDTPDGARIVLLEMSSFDTPQIHAASVEPVEDEDGTWQVLFPDSTIVLVYTEGSPLGVDFEVF